MKLKDKTAIITGAGSGMGRAAALLFAREGARIAAFDINEATAQQTAELVNAAGGKAVAFGCDVSDSACVKRAVDAAAAALGPATVLFNNAGLSSGLPKKALCDITEEAFDRMIAVNLRGAWLVMKHTIPWMIKAGGGTIVNTGSIAALIAANSAEYSASKSGVQALTRVAALDYGPDNIRVNTLNPGPTQTGMAKTATTAPSGGLKSDPTRLNRVSLLGRFAQPEEMAKAALFLCSDDSSYITGAALNVDGGWTIISTEGNSRSPI